MPRQGWLHGLGMMLLLAAAPRVIAAETEIREFTVLIDGKKATGAYHMMITRSDDGTQVMEGQADISLRYLVVYTYRYWYRGREEWKDGRLLRLKSSSNDDGKAFTVEAFLDASSLSVRVNSRERRVRPDVWTSTYWRLPDVRYRNQVIPLLDADTGRYVDGTLQYVETQPLNVGGQVQTCTHYKVTGLAAADLWYDAQERLVRQEALEDGRRYVLELARIRR